MYIHISRLPKHIIITVDKTLPNFQASNLYLYLYISSTFLMTCNLLTRAALAPHLAPSKVCGLWGLGEAGFVGPVDVDELGVMAPAGQSGAVRRSRPTD